MKRTRMIRLDGVSWRGKGELKLLGLFIWVSYSWIKWGKWFRRKNCCIYGALFFSCDSCSTLLNKGFVPCAQMAVWLKRGGISVLKDFLLLVQLSNANLASDEEKNVETF